MQTAQNSIAPENSLPQLGQVRWGFVIMALTTLQPQSEPKATPTSTEWCEIGLHSAWHSVVRFHKRMRYITPLNHVSEQIFYRWYPAASRVDNDFGRRDSSKLTAVSCSTFEVAVNRAVGMIHTDYLVVAAANAFAYSS
jgi:hypothetical protein